jgi:hypothetical protein
MNPSFSLQPASDFSIPELADFMTRSFEGYFVPIHMDANGLLGMVRRDSVDLTFSRVLLANGEPAGAGLVARRGWDSRVAGWGSRRRFCRVDRDKFDGCRKFNCAPWLC